MIDFLPSGRMQSSRLLAIRHTLARPDRQENLVSRTYLSCGLQIH